MSEEYIPVSAIESADLPLAVRAYFDTAPDNFKIPSVLTALCCYCALGTRLRVKYKP